MASPTKKAQKRRLLRKVRSGARRKAKDRVQGSTQPNLPLDKPNANELALKKAKTS